MAGLNFKSVSQIAKRGSLKFCYSGRGVMAGWCSKCAKNASLILCRIFDIVHNIKITFKGIRGIYYNFLSELQKVRLLYLRQFIIAFALPALTRASPGKGNCYEY